MPFRVGGGPVGRRLRFDASVSAVHSVRPVRPAVPASATCGRLSRYLQLLAARPGIRNSRPASPVHAGSHSSGSGRAVSVGFRRVGRLRVSRPPPAGSSASVGLRRVAPPRLKKQQPPAAELFRAAVVVLFAGRAVRVRSRSTSCSSGQASCSSSCRRAWASSPPWHTPPGRWRSAAAGFRPAP